MRWLLFLLIFTCHPGYSQDYRCLQNGTRRYFINSNGYLRGMRIDSVKSFADSIIYYPFHTPRGAYTDTWGPVDLDTNGGSWLGKKIIRFNDGTFLFDNYWGDTVTIKSHAAVGDSWTFFRDTTETYYKATVIAWDTMTVLGTGDSVKKIMINAWNTAGHLPSDPLDSFTIILSKDHGFAQVFDLYMFPYHQPDSTYHPGLDFFLDRSTLSYSSINGFSGYTPSAHITEFNLIDFINPNEQQLHDWHVGDQFQSLHSYGTFWPSGNEDFISNVIVLQSTTGHNIQYELVGSPGSCYLPGYYHVPCTFITSPGSITFSDTVFPLISTFTMPEEHFQYLDYIFYFPNDTSKCNNNPLYIRKPRSYIPSGLGGHSETTIYKLGIGMISYSYGDGEPNYEHALLTYYNMYYDMYGTACGTSGLLTTLHKPINISPNPFIDELSINYPELINNITIYNILGQKCFSQTFSSDAVQINLSHLEHGMYLIRINDIEVRKVFKL